MLDFADFIVAQQVREARRGGRAARRAQAVAAQSRRAFKAPPTSEVPGVPDDREPVQRSRASTRLFAALCARLDEQAGTRAALDGRRASDPLALAERQALIPGKRVRYLAEIAAGRARARETARSIGGRGRESRARPAIDALAGARRRGAARAARALRRCRARRRGRRDARSRLRGAYNEALDAIGTEGIALLQAVAERARGGDRPTSIATRCATAKSAATTTSRR